MVLVFGDGRDGGDWCVNDGFGGLDVKEYGIDVGAANDDGAMMDIMMIQYEMKWWW